MAKAKAKAKAKDKDGVPVNKTVPTDLQNAAKLKQDIADLEARKAKLATETEGMEAKQILAGGKKPTKEQAEKLAKERKTLLLARIESSTRYPKETIIKMRMEVRAISDGRWSPGYEPPNIPTAYDRHMNTET